MVLKNKYPVCEFDTGKNSIIQPTNFLAKILPEKCVVTFFRKELEQFVSENNLPVIGCLNSEVLDIPIYEYKYGTDKLCITMAFCGAPGAAVAIEELHAIIPVSAVRDEGTSYHYLEPSREVECHKETVKTVVSCLEQMGIPFTTGKTWTNDAIYRETPDMVELRRNEGCITVEMEAAAFFAVSQYYNIPLAQLLYAGDDVSGEEWDSRNWNTQRNIRYDLMISAIEIVKKL